MPVLEAMAAGLPVLTSNCSALPEVAGDAAILVDPYNVDAIGCALRKLTVNPELRKDLELRGKARAGLFSWERAVGETWNVYRKVMD